MFYVGMLIVRLSSDIVFLVDSLYYNWPRPLTLRLVRRLHRGVR